MDERGLGRSSMCCKRKGWEIERGSDFPIWQNQQMSKLGLSFRDFGVFAAWGSFGTLSWTPETERLPFVGVSGRSSSTDPSWERGSGSTGYSGMLLLPCRLTPLGTTPCSSSVGRSTSTALELLGGTALLPPKVVVGVSDILRFTGSLGKGEESPWKRGVRWASPVAQSLK